LEIKTLPTLLFLIFATACSSSQKARKEINREGEPLLITFHVYKGTHSFMKAAKNPRNGLNGECTYSLSDNVCSIKLLSKGTVVVDGVFTTTIGHEVMHCLYGDYHK